jgi:hypothetical protein
MCPNSVVAAHGILKLSDQRPRHGAADPISSSHFNILVYPYRLSHPEYAPLDQTFLLKL